MSQGRNISACSVIAIFVLAFVVVATSLPASAQSEAAGAPTVNHNTWTSGAPMPTPVYYPATGVLKGQIYIVGGGVTYTTYTSDVQIYNPVTNTWSTSVPFPTVSIAATGAVVKNILYIFGGSDGVTTSNAVWAFNPTTKTWSSKTPMPTARSGAVAVVVKNIVYVINGYNNGFLTTVESYNPLTDTWTAQA